jgi:response regulator RpfG family c-di-GMP phosphodiesterase
LRSDRPYRSGWPEDRVCAHIASVANTHLDPAVVQAFLQHVRQPEPIAGVSALAAGDHCRNQEDTGGGGAEETMD